MIRNIVNYIGDLIMDVVYWCVGLIWVASRKLGGR